VKTYGLVNLGRDKKPGSTSRVDERVLRLVKSKMPKRRWVLYLVEINEGDDNNERALIRKVWPDARLCDRGRDGRVVREPILLSPDLADTVESVRVAWVPDTGVRKWSPQRSIMRVFLDDGEVLEAAHYAAGANGQGSRPNWARGPLDRSWSALDRVHARGDLVMHRGGRNITWMQDRNAYTKMLVPDLGSQRTIVHHRTDWGKVWPAQGHRAIFESLPSVPLGLDSHGLLRMRGTYKERGTE
jgi:hypothetical protein